MQTRIILILTFLLFQFTFSFGNVDSLMSVVKSASDDTNKINTLLEISSQLWRSQPDSSMIYSQEAIDLSNRLFYRKGLALALKNMGLAYYVKSDYSYVLSYWQKSLEEYQNIGDNYGIGNLLNNIGAVYYNLGDNPKALEYYLESLKVSEKEGNQLRILTALTNIGAVYSRNEATYDKAESYLLRALPLAEELGDQNAVGTISVNLGDLFLDEGKLEGAIKYFEKALEQMREKDGNESYVLSSMGEAYLMQNNYKKALEYQNMAFQKASKIDAKLEKIIALYGIGDTYFAQEEYSNALNFYSQALTLAEDMGSKEELKNVYERLSKSYAAIGQYLNAYNYNGLYSALKDTLFNIENEQRMEGLQFQFEIEKKEDEIELLNKENALKEAEIQRAKIFRNFLLVGAAFLLVFLGGIVYQYNFVRRTNKIIIEERNRSDQLLKNILPLETAEELKVNGSVKAKKFEEVTVIFTDFVNFTQHAETIAPEILVENIDFYFKQFDEIFERHNLEKIKTIGDAYMGAGSIPLVNNTHPVDAVKAGLEILDFIHSLRIMNPNNIHLYNIRIGINTGPVIAGVVGKSKFQYDIWGDAVNIASRMETACGANKLNISESTYQKVKDHFEFEYRGNIEVKNRGKIKMYYVTGVKAMA